MGAVSREKAEADGPPNTPFPRPLIDEPEAKELVRPMTHLPKAWRPGGGERSRDGAEGREEVSHGRWS